MESKRKKGTHISQDRDKDAADAVSLPGISCLVAILQEDGSVYCLSMHGSGFHDLNMKGTSRVGVKNSRIISCLPRAVLQTSYFKDKYFYFISFIIVV